MDTTDAAAEVCRAIVEATSDAVIFADREGIIRLWNRGAERIFGFPAAEAVGQSLDIIIPERLRKAHWDAFDHSLKTGRTKHTDRVLTTRSMHRDGSKLYVDLSFGLVRDANRGPVGAFAIGRDCTTRYQSDTALKARVQELEEKLKTLSPDA